MSATDLFFGDSATRRLPIYILIDSSESMVGEPLDAVYQGLQQLIADLRNDPMAIETAWLSLITFGGKARQIVPLTDISRFMLPSLSVGPGTSLGAAFELLAQCVNKEVRKSTASQKGDWKPLVFLLTDGMPTDDWQAGLQRFRTTASVVNMIAVGCGDDIDESVLKAITPNVLRMKTASPGDFKAFFKWVSTSVSTTSKSASHEGQAIAMPEIPRGLEVVATPAAIASKTSSQVILASRCRDSKQGYLMRYRLASGGTYQAGAAYKVGSDYFAESSASPAGLTLDSNKLKGAPACPYCGRPGWTLAKDKSGLECNDRLALGTSRAQVMFVLDITGSMTGELEGVKDNIKDFIDFIHSEGLDAQAGLIAFRDLEMREPPEVLKFRGHPFTQDAGDFKSQVSRLSPNGGGSNPGESSFDALVLACQQPFEEDVARVLILITDEPPLIPDGRVRGVEDVIAAMGGARIDQLHIVIPDHLHSFYTPLHRHVKGQIFPLGRGGRGGTAFRKVLMDIGKSISVATRLG